jgi:hypothetical protein
MKNRILKLSLITLMLTTLTGCEVIGDIFQAGMGVGIFLVIIVIVLIVWLISRFRK